MKNNDLLDNARSLRQNMTKQEKHLWYDFLQNYPIKIYKQRIIDNYIVDFYCHQAKLVIEIDGAQHYTPDAKIYDQARTEVLERYGLLVLRFTNGDINERFDGVCYVIDKTIKERLALSVSRAATSPGVRGFTSRRFATQSERLPSPSSATPPLPE